MNPVARTAYGDIEGDWKEGVARFRGVPFAGPISNEGRFHPARPPARWSGRREGEDLAPMTPQVDDAAVVRDADYHRFLFGAFHDTPMSEDGLYLNVWTPAPERGAKRPVMVWLHGGGFATGTPTRAREEPSLLSARGDLVVVAPNHRLGAFGYLFQEGVTPNLGILDIVAALEWVRDNIENFGGDPGNVTVFGESGGAMKTATLLSLPLAQGLFHRGICQAGVFADGFRFAPTARDQASELSGALLARLGAKDVAALAARPMADIIAAQQELAAGAMAWRPVVDGEILPVDPGRALVDGRDADVPMIVGSAAHEAEFIFHRLPFTAAEVERQLGPNGRQVFDAYAAERAGASEADVADAVLTDFIFGMPAIAFAEARAKSGHPTYVYRLDWAREGARATHGAENPFVFDRLETTGYSRGAPDAAPLAAIMQQAWIAFARTGAPGADWPAYAAPERSVKIFDRNSRVVSDPKRAERAIWARTRA